MLTTEQAEARAAGLVEAARRAGADEADALYAGEGSTQVQVRGGKLEDVGRSEGEEIGLRVFVGLRSASVSSSDLSGEAMAALVERAVAMAREAPEDPYAGLAPAELLLREGGPDIDGDDGGDPSPADLLEAARACEEAALGVPGVTKSDGGSATAGRSVVALATSAGFARGYSTTGYGRSATVIAAGADGAMQRDYAFHSARHLADLEDAAAIGRRAGERAAARADPARVDSGAMPVMFDARVSTSLLGHLLGAITGSAIARKTSFLLGKEGERIFAPGVAVRDDPHRRRGLRSKAFDGEGLPTAPRDVVADGALTGWLLDSASARQLGRAPTGHAVRGVGGAPGAAATNLYMAAGTPSVAELIGDIERGILVTELIGQGVNGVTGDYSRGASGFLIERGEVTRPVAEITVAGNLLDMFARLQPANDLQFRRAFDAPTVRIDGMTVAGA